MKIFKSNIIPASLTIRESLNRLNELSSKDSLTLFVVDEQEVLKGSLTDGDIRRGLLKGLLLEDHVEIVMNKHPKFIRRDSFSVDEIDGFKRKEINLIPILDNKDRIEKIVDLSKMHTMLPVDAVLMAGGEGRRLLPLTLDTPKPLLKVGGMPIIERNIKRLATFGVDTFYVSIRYLGHMIKECLGDGSEKGISITYLEETDALGTIGSVRLNHAYRHEDILVMNSDLLTDLDFEDFYRAFKNSGADMMVACTPYQVVLPYGVVETDNMRVVSIKEKPTYTYYSNAGIYLFKRDVVRQIPAGERFDATNLMEVLINSGGQVINYPILTYWLDIGKHEDFAKACNDINHVKF